MKFNIFCFVLKCKKTQILVTNFSNVRLLPVLLHSGYPYSLKINLLFTLAAVCTYLHFHKKRDQSSDYVRSNSKCVKHCFRLPFRLKCVKLSAFVHTSLKSVQPFTFVRHFFLKSVFIFAFVPILSLSVLLLTKVDRNFVPTFVGYCDIRS